MQVFLFPTFGIYLEIELGKINSLVNPEIGLFITYIL